MSLAHNIKLFREEQDMSKSDLALALDVPVESISKWESGVLVPELDKMIRMSTIFEVTLNEMLHGRAHLPEKVQADDRGHSETHENMMVSNQNIAWEKIKQLTVMTATILIWSTLICLAFFFHPLCAILAAVGCSLSLLSNHPLYCSGWVVCFLCWVFLSAKGSPFFLNMVLFQLAPFTALYMIIWTTYLHHRKVIRIPAWIMILGFILLAVLLWKQLEYMFTSLPVFCPTF